MPLHPDTSLSLVETLDDAMEFKRWLGERHVNDAIAIDTETSGLGPREPEAKIRLIQFGDTVKGWAISWEDWRGLALEALRGFDGLQIYHNLAFEMRWIQHFSDYRIPRDRTVDTMIAAHIVNPLGSGSLKVLGDQFVDRRASAGQQDLHNAMSENKWTWATIPITFQPFWFYGALDCVLTANLWEYYRPKVTDDGPYRAVFDMEMAVRHICSRMEERGARVDLEYSAAQRERLDMYAREIDTWGQNAYGIRLGSPQQLAAKIIEHGGEFTEYTKTGQPKTDKGILKVMADPDNGYPLNVQLLAEQALALRDARKTSSTYFSAFLDRSYDSIIHPEIRTLAARTARMSMSGIPIQQLPKGSPLVRRAIVPSSPDNVIITTDYSQIEMRLMAEFSRDAGLQGAFNTADSTGGDFFVEIGKQVYADPGFQRSDKRRGLIKNMAYGMSYGAGPAKMAESAGVTVERMNDVVQRLMAAYPGLKQFMKQVEDVGRVRERTEGQAYIITPIGRRLPADQDKTYTLVNYLLQSSAADVLKNAIVRLDAAGYDDWMLFPVHDEVVMDIPRDLADQAMAEVPEIMAEMEHSVPLTAASDGPLENWGQKYE